MSEGGTAIFKLYKKFHDQTVKKHGERSVVFAQIGDFYELDEILFHRFDSGWSTYGLIKIAKMANNSLFGILFPYYPFMSWCKKNLGLKNIFRNLDIFLKMNLSITFFLFVDLMFILKMKLEK